MSTRNWMTAATGSAALAAAVIVPPAQAGVPVESGVADRVEQLNAWIYFDDGLVLFTGSSLAACGGQLPTGTFTVVSTPADVTVTVNATHDRVYVYDAQGFGDPFAFIGQACALPPDERPQSIAWGDGVVTHTTQSRLGVESGRGTVTASLTTADGGSAHVTARGTTTSFEEDVITYTG